MNTRKTMATDWSAILKSIDKNCYGVLNKTELNNLIKAITRWWVKMEEFSCVCDCIKLCNWKCSLFFCDRRKNKDGGQPSAEKSKSIWIAFLIGFVFLIIFCSEHEFFDEESSNLQFYTALAALAAEKLSQCKTSKLFSFANDFLPSHFRKLRIWQSVFVLFIFVAV